MSQRDQSIRDQPIGPDGLTRRDRDLIREVLAHYPDVRRVTLFGSRAMGTFGRGSDIDLALEGPDLTPHTLARIATELEDSDLPYKVDLLLRDDQLEPKLEAHIRRHGKPFGWEVTTLGDVGSIVTGKTPPTKREEFFGGSIPFVTPTDMDGRRDIATTDRFLTEDGAARVSGARIPKCAVLVSCIGSDMGKSALAGTSLITNQQINSIIVSPPNSNLFVYYNLSRRKDEIRAVAGGSAQPILNKSAFSRLKLLLPTPNEQRAIAAVLGALDDKIEQNRRTAQALERLARAIFRAWFVDFEPVKAKAAGATAFPSMPQPVFDALPTRFVDSAIGPVPEGWEVKTVGDLITLPYGKALKADTRVEGSIPVYGSNGQVGWHDVPLVERAGIVIGRKGNPGTVERVGQPFFPIDTTFYVDAKNSAPKDEFLFYLLQNLDLPRLNADSAVPGLNLNAAYAESCICPNSDLCDSFAETASATWLMVEQANGESRKLAAMRDYLLPKLLSGQVRVSDADQFVTGGVA